jgi:hypothetical protein
MSDDLYQQIYNNMNLKDTEELLNIWITNDRTTWSDAAIEAIENILGKRSIELPTREMPAAEEMQEEIEDEEAEYNPDEFTEEEREIIEDENPPEFYDPFEVLDTSHWMEIVAKVMVGAIVLSNAVKYSTIWNIVHAYFVRYPIPLLEFYITFSVITTKVDSTHKCNNEGSQKR